MKIGEHKCEKFKIIELAPGHILGNEIVCYEMKDTSKVWVIGDGQYCSVISNRKCMFCGKDLDEELL